MKKYIIFFLALCFSLSAQAGGEPINEVEADSDIEAVTVFLNSAQVQRNTEVLLRRGKNRVILRGLAKNIDPKSIQVKAPNEVLINSVTIERNYLNLNAHQPRVIQINDSLKLLQDLRAMETTRQRDLMQERDLLLANQQLASKKEGLDLASLQQTSTFFRKRLFDLTDRIRKSTFEQRDYKRREKQLKAQLRELNYVRDQPSHDISIILNTFSTRKVPVEVSYVVQDARWVPRYNLRAKDSSSPIQLEYQADVIQNTGVDWEDVLLTLSTGNPNLGGSQPVVRPWKLYVQAPPPPPAKYKKKAGKTQAMGVPMTEAEEESGEDDWGDDEDYVVDEPTEQAFTFEVDEMTSLADYTVVQEGAVTAEFRISIRQNIRSGNKAEQVTVQNSELPSVYRHFGVPKLDPDAFLVSEVTGWEGLNLLAGNVQIFFEGSYVSESYIDPSYTDDTLRFSLGRDKRVVIEREQLKNYKEKKIFGSQIERTFAYSIKVRNTKDEPVQIRLEDQIPISQDKSIVVKVEELTGANLNEDNGLLYWDLDIAPAQTQELKLIYSVKYPKNRSIPGL